MANILTWHQLETYITDTLINGVTRSRHESGHVTFPGTSYNAFNFLVEMSTFKQVIKLSFGCKKFGTAAVEDIQARIKFLKKSRDQVDKSADQLHL